MMPYLTKGILVRDHIIHYSCPAIGMSGKLNLAHVEDSCEADELVCDEIKYPGQTTFYDQDMIEISADSVQRRIDDTPVTQGFAGQRPLQA